MADGQFGDFFAEFDVLVEPQFERVTRYGGHQFEGVAVGELVFGLALELRVEHARAQHKRHFAEYIVALHFHAARQQVVVGDEIVHRMKHGLFQTGFVGAAQRGGDEVDVAFVGATAFFQPSERKRRALSGGEIAVVAV